MIHGIYFPDLYGYKCISSVLSFEGGVGDPCTPLVGTNEELIRVKIPDDASTFSRI